MRRRVLTFNVYLRIGLSMKLVCGAREHYAVPEKKISMMSSIHQLSHYNRLEKTSVVQLLGCVVGYTDYTDTLLVL